MSAALPPNFLDLNTACSRVNSEVNVMGVVTDFMAPGRSRGTDCMCSFSITDPTYVCYNNVGLKVRFFRPSESELPAIQRNGDIVLLRFLKINEWGGMTVGLSNRGTTWTVFPSASIPTKFQGSPKLFKHLKEPRAPVPSPPEVRYAISLHESSDPGTFIDTTPVPSQASPHSIPSGSAIAGRVWKDKFALIKAIGSDSYYDLVGQVVKIYPHNDRVELYVTDYTSNTLLWNYEWGEDDADGSGREGDTYNYVPRASTHKKWPGPFGKMTLTVTLWPPHAYFGRQNVKENDNVHLRNVHIKFSRDSKLEGVLHTDQRYPDRIDVTILKNSENDDRVKDLLRRKRDYTKKFQKSSESFVAEARGLKRKSVEETESKPLSKTAQRKKRKQERKQLANAEYRDTNERLNKETEVRIKVNDQSLGNKSITKAQMLNLNPNVNCSNHLITSRSLLSILSADKNSNITPEGTSYTLPFQNINSRATVSVVDFFPSDLVDFAIPCPKSSEYDILSDPGDSSNESENDTQVSSDTGNGTENVGHWEWRFGLRLEDVTGPKNEEKATMDVYVVGQDAECLLKLDAEDLRKSPKALAALREKLFLLWGDLEEHKTRQSTVLEPVNGNSRSPRKDEMPKCKPFQCCLKEYGVKKRLQRSIEEEHGESGNEETEENNNWVWQRKWRMFGVTII